MSILTAFERCVQTLKDSDQQKNLQNALKQLQENNVLYIYEKEQCPLTVEKFLNVNKKENVEIKISSIASWSEMTKQTYKQAYKTLIFFLREMTTGDRYKVLRNLQGKSKTRFTRRLGRVLILF